VTDTTTDETTTDETTTDETTTDETTTDETSTRNTETAVRRSVIVDVAIEHAFTFFTENIAAWWDPKKHLLGEPLAEMIFEPRVGGQIIDRGVNGAESRWATVIAYEPPTHVAFSWDIDLAWQIEGNRAKRSEVHVTFTAQGEGRTLVELEHRHLDRHGEGWQAMRDAVGSPNGWDLEPYASAITAANDTTSTVTGSEAAIGYRSEFRLGKPVAAVFDALGTTDGLAGWWSPVTGSAVTGGELRFAHQQPGTLVITVEEASRHQVCWKVVSYAANPEWDGTEIVFSLEPDPASGTLVRFQHRGLVPSLSCFESCRAGWDYFLNSFREYVEHGVGSPLSPNEDDGRMEVEVP
jgi:uncharacterized protein YndB with AHSA1/START domain